MEGRPACTRVGIRQAQEDVRFLQMLAGYFRTLRCGSLLVGSVGCPSSEDISQPPEVVVPEYVSEFLHPEKY